ncbi:MAG: site-specific DNA-methyltransferase [Endomicrobium sp.]|jgi:site-specific DNA-methyltransferase (adenine-specific)|nr:site-specific DNA-methyltransferase [Endomicrobium sp.]
MLKTLLNTIINDDCLKILKHIPDNCVDMTFADPPFNLKKKYNRYDDAKETQEYLNWCNIWLSEMVRITKPTGAIFVHNIPRWLSCLSQHLNKIAYFKHWIVWDSPSVPLGKTLLPNHYGILYYTKSKSHKDFKFFDIRMPHPRCRICKEFLKDYGGKKALAHGFGPLISDVWNDIHRIRHKKRRDEHPCQLPVHLLERLILMTTEENDIVLDPFVGTGTTAVAAKKLGRKYIGIEQDKKYEKISQTNIANAEQTKVNGCFVSVYLGKIRTIRDIDFKTIFNSGKNFISKEQDEYYTVAAATRCSYKKDNYNTASINLGAKRLK